MLVSLWLYCQILYKSCTECVDVGSPRDVNECELVSVCSVFVGLLCAAVFLLKRPRSHFKCCEWINTPITEMLILVVAEWADFWGMFVQKWWESAVWRHYKEFKGLHTRELYQGWCGNERNIHIGVYLNVCQVYIQGSSGCSECQWRTVMNAAMKISSSSSQDFSTIWSLRQKISA